MQRYGVTRIKPVMATRNWYRENMPPLKARFEDRTIEIPRDPDIRQDLRSVRVDKGVPMVPEGVRSRSIRGGQRHGDAAIAAALLERAAQRAADVSYGYEPVTRGRGIEPASDDDRFVGERISARGGW